MSRSRVATYRLQLHRGFTFADAARVAPYLTALGVTHLYLSPVLTSRSGSPHGYDVIDHEHVDDELGGRDGLRALADAWPGDIVVDIVPNHMAVIGGRNRWWWDVLKHGPASPFAEFFDINWDPHEDRLKRSILVPILGDHYGRVLDRGEVKLDRHDGDPVVRYFEHTFPLAPSTRPHDVEAINADVDLLHEILDAQHYRLAYWKVAGSDLNYRRFFAINELAALRVDRPEVFDATHRAILELVRDGIVAGLRIDHIDGLRYPRSYLERLRDATDGLYTTVEKILEGDEELPAQWPVAGTTGYEFISRVDGLFIDSGAEKPLDETYHRFLLNPSFCTEPPENGGLVQKEGLGGVGAKLEIMGSELRGDVERLTDLLVAVCEDERRYRDFTRPELRHTLRETIASFDVYRTYVDPSSRAVTPADRAVIDAAIADAQARRTDLDPQLFDLLRRVLLLELEGDDAAALAMRFQQATGPVMAKGIEDTYFYRFNRFAALNEVGGDPGHFGTSVDDFHRFNARTQQRWPETMRAGSTHDTKRSEDVRARLALLSEIPDAWNDAVARWARHNEGYRAGEWPDRNMEYLLYQTLVGAWPLTTERLAAYMDKAAKEAKVHTSWISPDDNYDAALRAFVESVMTDPTFTADVERFVEPLVVPGYVNSLAQLLLRMTSPGVPDLYQGTEVWDLSLVDPDNRRAVDYEARTELLHVVRATDAAAAWAEPGSGLVKLLLIHAVLDARARHPDAFGPAGAYVPLHASGSHAGHVVSFSRGDEIVTIVPRLAMTVGGRWDDTAVNLPDGVWVDTLTGTRATGAAPLSVVVGTFPVALLERDRS